MLWIGIPIFVTVFLWLIVFEIPIFFTPLRFKPEKITVYSYGQSYVYTKKDEEFSEIYHSLRAVETGTIYKCLSDDVVMDSHKIAFREDVEGELFRNQSIVIYLSYGTPQKGRLPGASGDVYDEVIFILDGKNSSIKAGDVWGYCPVFYSNTQESAESYRCFVNYDYPQKAEEYIDSLAIISS